MTDDYTPTTAQIRGLVAVYPWGGSLFDAWLAAHDREVAAKAWDEGRAARYRPELDNPYRADD